jgi:hypothetical protein
MTVGGETHAGSEKRLNFFGVKGCSPNAALGKINLIYQHSQILHNFCQFPPLQTGKTVL